MPSTPRSRASGRGPDGNQRPQVTAPVSERQQLALVMQISSQDAPPAPPPPTAEEKKKTRRNERGETALHVAAIKGDHEHVKKLLDQGQNPDVQDFAETSQLSSGIVSSSQDDASDSKRRYSEDSQDNDGNDDEGNRRKKRKDIEEKELMGKPAPVSRGGPGRVLTGNKPPGPASKTGAPQLNKSAQNTKGGTGGSSSGKGNLQSQGKGGGAGAKSGAQGAHQGKSSGSTKGASSSQANKQDRKSPVTSPKTSQSKDTDGDSEDQKTQESAAPKVPPLKIVIPGGASGSGNRNEQEGEGGSGQRGGGKGRGSAATLPYVIPCTSTEATQASTSDSSDGNFDDKRTGDSSKGQDCEPSTSSAGTSGRSETVAVPGPSVELHPRKRKIKASKDQAKSDQSSQARAVKSEAAESSTQSQNVANSNPYQMYIHIRKQIDRRQRGLFPVKPKPPKDFNKYLMNRCTYTLQGNVNPEQPIEIPPTLPTQMVEEFTSQEKERTKLRIQHLVEKEKLVLAVEQEILRVHGRAERAVANQALPFSVCTILRDREVYNVLAPEQEEKRNAQRSRCNGRQINSWLQEVDDKWERIKEGMLRRQHTEAETLHKVQIMEWEWKLKEVGLCDYKTSPQIDPKHVPQIHVANFDLPA